MQESFIFSDRYRNVSVFQLSLPLPQPEVLPYLANISLQKLSPLLFQRKNSRHDVFVDGTGCLLHQEHTRSKVQGQAEGDRYTLTMWKRELKIDRNAAEGKLEVIVSLDKGDDSGEPSDSMDIFRNNRPCEFGAMELSLQRSLWEYWMRQESMSNVSVGCACPWAGLPNVTLYLPLDKCV